MFLARRKLTLATAILAAIAYVIRNYDIEGLESVRIQSRVASPSDEGFDLGLPSTSRYVSTQRLPQALPGTAQLIPVEPVVKNLAPSSGGAGANSPSRIAAGESMDSQLGQGLGAAERITVWQETQERSSAPATTVSSVAPATVPNNVKTIRIASFNLQAFGSVKRSKSHVMEIVVQLIRPFDVIALQEIASNQDDLLPDLCERLNQSGRQYDYLIGPRVGRGAARKQFAIVFESSRIETDRYQLYTVDDPQDLMDSEPLVGWFRVKGLAKEQAFTFSLVNYQCEAHLAAHENRFLPDLIHAIEQDGRREDDWILAGDLGASDSQLAHLTEAGVRFALRGIPTVTRGTHMLDNILFSNHATGEFTGRAGVVDFLRLHNFSLEQAMEISDHLPIWAEFTSHEGGLLGRVAD